ncbi:hypothetical protein [Hymenobacter antarcticus]
MPTAECSVPAVVRLPVLITNADNRWQPVEKNSVEARPEETAEDERI